MDFNKFCENGKKIKLTEEKKAEIINVSKESEVQKASPFSPNFKRIAAAVCAMIIMVTTVFVYNKHNDTNDILIHSATEQSEKESLKAVETTTVQPSQKIENTEDNDIGGADLVLHKYRQNYYTIPAPFSDIVDSEEFEEWYGEIINQNPNETNKMIIKEFILQFDVPKEDFERANLEWAKIVKYKLDGKPVMNPQDFSNQETDEVYNVDILYTLNDEIINNYYLSHNYPYTFSDEYEEAVASGEHTPLTEDWIDIEQMEADIIAKYGESEIVTETTIPEEITATDLSQIETTE